MSLELYDSDYSLYTYSLDIEGLPDWLKASGDIVSNDSVRRTYHHEFTLSGTPAAYADKVNVTFTATVNVSGDTPILRTVCSKDVNISLKFYTISYDLQGGTLTSENPVSYDFTTPA